MRLTVPAALAPLRVVVPAALAVCALALSPRPAAAQTPADTKPPSIVTVRGGLYLPQNSRVKNATSSTWFGGGLDYHIQQKPGLSRTVLSLDYIERKSHGNLVRIIPVTVGQFTLQGAANPNAAYHPYFGVGAGAYFVHQEIPDDVGIQENKNQTAFGGYFAAGIDFKDNLLVEARYHILNKVGSANSSGLQAMIGFRL